jgi:hypothetical protein
MSPTSEVVAERLFDWALTLGMPSPELARWREEIDSISLDACGCRASARAAAASAVLVTAVGLAAVGPRPAVAAGAGAATLIAGVAGKLVGSRSAELRRSRLLTHLDARMRDLQRVSRV